MTSIDKLLNFLDEHDALHSFFAETDSRYFIDAMDFIVEIGGVQDTINSAFSWANSIDGYDYWKNLYDKAGEL